MNSGMIHTISMGLTLAILWLLLSTHFEPLMLGFGTASVILTLIIARRMGVIDRESYPFHLIFLLPRFWFLLQIQIARANIDVTLRILGIRPISPTVFSVPDAHQTELEKAIYANAITLTPGTASIEVEPGAIVVHALSEEGAEELKRGYLASIVPETGHVIPPTQKQP